MAEPQITRASPDEGSTRRLEALSDGVFAVAMTLLVLEFRIPEVAGGPLAEQLARVIPTLLIYALTFLVLGMLWFGHRVQFESIASANHPLVWLSLLFLGTIAIIPFSAAVLGRFGDERLAVLVYGGNLVAATVTHGATWAYASLHPELLDSHLDERYRRVSRIAAFTPAVGYVVGTLVGMVEPIAGLVIFVLVPVPFVFGIYYRLLARVARGRVTAGD